jgi:subtilisin family serine protease
MPTTPISRTTALIAAGLLTACGAADAPDLDGAEATLRAALTAGETRSAIVSFRAPEPRGVTARRVAPPDGFEVAEDLVGAVDERLALVKEAAVATAPSTLRVQRRLHHLPAMHVLLSSVEALDHLLAQPDVEHVYPDERHAATLSRSLPFIGQPLVAAGGLQGQGTSVAILDTGLDYTRPEFGGCAAPGKPASCRVAYAGDVAAPQGGLDDRGHGTNVAAIVAAVAPGARLIALNVFSGRWALTSDILAAIDWCMQHRAEYRIVAMNLSLGGGSQVLPCSRDPLAGSLQAARAAGILAAVAAGNDGSATGLASPACAPAAVSVGAVYSGDFGGLQWASGCTDATTAADQIACFSNSSPFLTLLAPGALISTGGATMGGTSQAAPHVAGAIAVLRSAFPGDSAEDALARLRATGKPVIDPRNGASTPRLDLAAAVRPGPAPPAVAPPGSARGQVERPWRPAPRPWLRGDRLVARQP